MQLHRAARTRGERRDRQMVVEPVVRALQLSSFLGREAASVTKEPGLGNDAV